MNFENYAYCLAAQPLNPTAESSTADTATSRVEKPAYMRLPPLTQKAKRKVRKSAEVTVTKAKGASGKVRKSAEVAVTRAKGASTASTSAMQRRKKLDKMVAAQTLDGIRKMAAKNRRGIRAMQVGRPRTGGQVAKDEDATIIDVPFGADNVVLSDDEEVAGKDEEGSGGNVVIKKVMSDNEEVAGTVEEGLGGNVETIVISDDEDEGMGGNVNNPIDVDMDPIVVSEDEEVSSGNVDNGVGISIPFGEEGIIISDSEGQHRIISCLNYILTPLREDSGKAYPEDSR